MNEYQAYLLAQSSNFRIGYNDYMAGHAISYRPNCEWRRGWEWAETIGARRLDKMATA